MKRLIIAMPLLAALAACGAKTAAPVDQTFKAPISVPATEVANWRVQNVRVTIPEKLTVSTNPNISLPRDAITWWGEPDGDRKAQVSAIMKRAALEGSAFLRGRRPVVMDIQLARFHALTPKARSREFQGWHDIQFSIFVRDAASGEVLARSGSIDAGFSALQGAKANEAVARGQTQKVRINRRVSSVVNAWLNSRGTIGTAPVAAKAPAPKRTVRNKPKPAAPAPAPAAAPAPVGVDDVGPDSGGGDTAITSASVAVADASSGASGTASECLNVDARHPKATDKTGC